MYVPIHGTLLCIVGWEFVSAVMDYAWHFDIASALLHVNISIVLSAGLCFTLRWIAQESSCLAHSVCEGITVVKSSSEDVNVRLALRVLLCFLLTALVVVYTASIERVGLGETSVGSIPGFSKIVKILDYVSLPYVILEGQIVMTLVEFESNNAFQSSCESEWRRRWV